MKTKTVEKKISIDRIAPKKTAAAKAAKKASGKNHSLGMVLIALFFLAMMIGLMFSDTALEQSQKNLGKFAENAQTQ